MRGPVAVILAAGKGTRLDNESLELPKCLARLVQEETILDFQLRAIFSEILRIEIVIVTGYKAKHIEAHVAQRWQGAPIRFVYTDTFEAFNTARSVYAALTMLGGERDIYLLNGDVVFDAQVLGLLARDEASVRLATKRGRCGAEEIKVQLATDGSVIRIGKRLDQSSAFGEAFGVNYFAARTLLRYSEALFQSFSKDARAYFEDALDDLLQSGALSDVRAVDIGTLAAVEVDFPQDLVEARRIADGLQ